MEQNLQDLERLEQSIEIAAPIEQVFDFHIDTNNLLKITPRHISVSFTTEGEPGVGQTIDLTVKHFGIIPTRWKVRFTAFDRPHLLVDEQVHGPFAVWIQSRILKSSATGTTLTDVVEYRAPLGFVGKIASRFFINRQIRNMFAHRQKRTKQLLEASVSS